MVTMIGTGETVKKFLVCAKTSNHQIKEENYSTGFYKGSSTIQIHSKKYTYKNKVGYSGGIACMHAVIRYWKKFKLSKHNIYAWEAYKHEKK